MKKVLIVSGHSNIQHDSVVNSLILKQVKQALPQVEIDLLCELYPDFKIDVAAEQAKVLEADIIVFQFPLYWFAKPSILQRWEEEVFLHGFSHGCNGDKLKGKKLIVSFTVGAPGEVYSREGGPCGMQKTTPKAELSCIANEFWIMKQSKTCPVGMRLFACLLQNSCCSSR